MPLVQELLKIPDKLCLSQVLLQYTNKKKVKTSIILDLDLFLLPEINTIYNLP